MKDDALVEAARAVWHETGTLLEEKYGFDKATHEAYIKTTEGRFRNPHLSDAVTRVARGPKRKLGAKDRLVSPAEQLIERGYEPKALARVIAAALPFDLAIPCYGAAAVRCSGFLAWCYSFRTIFSFFCAEAAFLLTFQRF